MRKYQIVQLYSTLLVKSFSRHTSGVRIPFFYKTKNALWTFFVLWRRVRDFHSSLRDPPPCGSAPAPPWTRVCSSIHRTLPLTTRPFRIRIPEDFYYKRKDVSRTSFRLWRRVRDFHSSLRDLPPCGSAPAPPWTRVCSSIHRTLPLTTRPFRVRIPEDFYYKRKDASRTSFRLWRRVRDFHSSLRDLPPCGSAPAPPWTRVCSSIHRTLPLTTRPFRVRIPEDFYYKRKDASRTSFRLWRRVRDSNPGSG